MLVFDFVFNSKIQTNKYFFELITAYYIKCNLFFLLNQNEVELLKNQQL